MRFEIWFRLKYNDGSFKSDYLDIRMETEPSCATFEEARARCTELNENAGVLEYYVRTPFMREINTIEPSRLAVVA